MIDKYDDMMNEYIDNLLSTGQINELIEYLTTDNNAYKKLKALRLVDEILKELEVYKAPVNFTEKIMHLITTKSIKIQQGVKRFTVTIISFLILLCVLFCAATIYFKESSTTQLESSLNEFIAKGIFYAEKFMNNNLFLLITSSVLLCLLSAFYIIYEAHINLKNKLKRIP